MSFKEKEIDLEISILETERLILRPWTEEDAGDLYCYASHPDVAPMAGWPVHTSVENSREIIRGVLSEPETYAVVLKEAVREMLRHGFQDLNLDKIWCMYFEGNVKSKRVQEKCGFQFQYRREDRERPLLGRKGAEYISCITRKEWEQNT